MNVRQRREKLRADSSDYNVHAVGPQLMLRAELCFRPFRFTCPQHTTRRMLTHAPRGGRTVQVSANSLFSFYVFVAATARRNYRLSQRPAYFQEENERELAAYRRYCASQHPSFPEG